MKTSSEERVAHTPRARLLEKWKCLLCKFPENFLPTCSMCGRAK